MVTLSTSCNEIMADFSEFIFFVYLSSKPIPGVHTCGGGTRGISPTSERISKNPRERNPIVTDENTCS